MEEIYQTEAPVKTHSPHRNEDSFLNLRPYKDDRLLATETREMIIVMILMFTWPGVIWGSPVLTITVNISIMTKISIVF